MTQNYIAQPDLGFITQVRGLGGDTLKKCFQCATCSVACPIAPEDSPFPRKEMIAASWGLKDKLVGNADIWLCHQCGDCTTMCPRGAAPGDVLAAVRSAAITEYGQPKVLAEAVNDPKKLPWLIAIPGIWFLLLAYITMAHSDIMTKIFDVIGLDWIHAHPGGEHVIAQADFFSTWFVDMTFVPLSMMATLVFFLGLRRFIADIHHNALVEGKTKREDLDYKALFQAFLKVLPTIMKHRKFTTCESNKDRATPHIMVLFSFIGLFIVTAVFFVVLYGFHLPSPYSQLNPIKCLANISGVALMIGSTLMIKNRMANKDQVSTYKDWYILGVVFALGFTGMITEIARLAYLEYTCYFFYWLHLIAIFNLFAFLPFCKMAHLVYRAVAMAYAEYAGRSFA